MFEPITYTSFMSSILVHAGLVVFSVLCLVIYLTKKDSRIAKFLTSFNGPPAWPLVGNALSLLGPHESLLPVLMKWVKSYGFTFRGWIGNVPYIFVALPNHVERVLSSTVHINKGKDYEYFLEPWLGTGLLTARREKWYHRRKLLTPTFHFKILEDFIPVFNEQSKTLITILEQEIKKSEVLDICPFMSKCALDVICETAMGEKINAQTGGEKDYVKKVCGLSDLVIMKALNPIYRNPYIWNMTNLGKLEAQYLQDLHDFTDKVIKERKRKRRNSISEDDAVQDNPEGTKVRKAFLDLLLDMQEQENKLNDADIREEVDTFMFEGHDTTGANLEWVCLMLACHPEHQKRVHEELDNLFVDDLDRDITTTDLKQLKYLDCVIKETLRLYPSVPFFIRSADQDIELDETKTIPKGSSLMVSPYILHRDPVTFPDPEKFDPDRFTAENSVGRHPYAYVPFSAGPRNCIGQKFAIMEEKIILATFLKKFRLEAVDTMETVVMVPDVILRPKNGIKVKLIKRQ